MRQLRSSFRSFQPAALTQAPDKLSGGCLVSVTGEWLSLIVIPLLLPWCLVCWSQTLVAQQAAITVGPNVQVSKARSNFVHNEVLLAADPSNAKNLLGCTMAFSPEQNKILTIAYVSSDGGNSWNFAVTNDRGILSGDPACTFGVDGHAYFTAVERSERANDRLVVYRSDESGKTWATPLILLGSAPAVDRPYVIVDQSAGSYRGRVYVYGQIAQRTVDGESVGLSIALWRSRDNGVTFEGPIVRSRDKPLSFHPANSVVLSDGTLVCLIAELDPQKRNDGYGGSQYRKADFQNGTLKVVASSDGGESLSPAVKISEIYEDWREEGTGIPSLAADRGSPAFKDRLYAAWADGRFGRTQILVSYSTDKGKTWSSPHLVSDGQPTVGDGPDNFMPVVAVNPEGVVGIMWYDRRDIPGNFGYYVRFTASLDGGDTWQPSVRVSELPKTLETKQRWPITAGVWRNGVTGPLSFNLRRYEWLSGGHTAGMAADLNGAFHPFWIDNRSGVSQIWTASVVVSGVVATNGSLELSRLEDVSGSAMLELTDCTYETISNIVSCAARIKNSSKETLTGPLELRVIGLKSELGAPQVINPDNGRNEIGAVWVFGDEIRGGLLQPDQDSDSKQLRFQILNPQEFQQGNHFKSTFVLVDVRVLGHIKRPASVRPSQ
jgi:hypothetical protein